MSAAPQPVPGQELTRDTVIPDGLHPVEQPDLLTGENDLILLDEAPTLQPLNTKPKTTETAVTVVESQQPRPTEPTVNVVDVQQARAIDPAENTADNEDKMPRLSRPIFILGAINVLLIVALIVVTVVLSQQIRAASSTAGSGSNNTSQTSPAFPQPTGTSTSQPSPATPVPFKGVGPGMDDKNNICLATMPLPSSWGVPKAECPGSNGTIFTLPGTTLKFQRNCDSNLPGNDIMHVPIVDFKNCLALCAFINVGQNTADSTCQGVTWVYGDGPQGGQSPGSVRFCFLKSRADSSSFKAGAESAVLLPG